MKRCEHNKQIKVACSWSSGKDSCLACYKAIQQGFKVSYLMNFISQEYKRVSFHGVWHELVKMQAHSVGIKLLQREVPPPRYEKYEQTFRETLIHLKSDGIKTLVCGDIFLLDCRNWVEEKAKEVGFDVIEPLWNIDSKEILKEFISLGFKAIVTATQAKLLDESWVGREINLKFIEDLEKKGGIDLCGENGEYHTFVFDGPIFKKPIEILKTEKILRDGYWFLDIKEYRLSKLKENKK